MYIEQFFTLYASRQLTDNVKIKIFRYIQIPKYFFKMEFRNIRTNTFYEKYSNTDFYSPYDIIKNTKIYFIEFMTYCALKELEKRKKSNAIKKPKKKSNKQKV